jgi:hypothetical protein
MPRQPMRPAEEAFVITVGVRHSFKDRDCAKALKVLERAGFRAGQTSEDALIQLGEQAKLVKELREASE